MKENIKAQTEAFRKEIETYLASEDRPFGLGFRLMQKYSTKISVMHMICRKREKPLMKQKLDYELACIAKQAEIKLSPYSDSKVMAQVHPGMKAIIKASEVQGNEKTSGEDQILDAIDAKEKEADDIVLKARLKVVTAKLDVTEDELPAAIAELYAKARRYYHLYSHYHTQMKLVPEGDENNEARAKALKLAKEYEDLNKAAWAEIDAWAEAGKPEIEEEAKDETSAEVRRAIGSAESYISRYADTLEELEGKKYEARKEMLIKKVGILTANKEAIPAKKADVLKKHGIIG